MSELLEQIRVLSVSEKLGLVREIVNQLEQAEEWKLSPEDEAELSRRLEASKANPLEGDDWATVRARIVAETQIESSKLAEAA